MILQFMIRNITWKKRDLIFLKLLKLHLMQVLDTAISDINKLKSFQKRETIKSLRKPCFVSMTCEQMLKEMVVFISFSKARE